MTERTKEARVAKLKSVAEERKREASGRADKAIRRLLMNRERLTFANVARQAGLSVAYLYKYPELKRRIQHLRAEQDARGTNKVKPPPASEKSKQVVVQHLKQRIRELEAEREEQKEQIAALTGQVYELTGEKELAERLREENERLAKRVRELEAAQQAVSTNDSPAPDISDVLKDAFSELGIRLTDSLRDTIRAHPETRVMNALAVVREARDAGTVRSTARLFVKALQEGWEPAGEDASVGTKRERGEFSRWFDLARKKGLVKVSRGTERGIMILTAEDKWVPYESLREAPGWSVAELQS